jgi:hypothetical protein
MLQENIMIVWLCVCVLLLILCNKLIACSETSVNMSLNLCSLKFPSATSLAITCKGAALEPLSVGHEVLCMYEQIFWGVGECVSSVR